MKRNIISTFKSYQQQRLKYFKNKNSLSSRIKKSAQDKRIDITPKVQLLIEAIGDTIDDDNTTADADDLYDISDLFDDDDQNDFHDTAEQVHNQQE